jgi:hypothetical protein
MAESLTFRDLSDKLYDLVADARALQMAITGADTLCGPEKCALLHFASKHLDACEEIQAAVNVQYEAEVKAFKEAEMEGKQ